MNSHLTNTQNEGERSVQLNRNAERKVGSTANDEIESIAKPESKLFLIDKFQLYTLAKEKKQFSHKYNCMLIYAILVSNDV